MSTSFAADFRRLDDITAPAAGTSGHIDIVQVTALLFDAWMGYLVPGLGLDRESVLRPVGRPIVRSTTVDVEAEIRPGQVLQCGVRAQARRTRSFTLGGLLAHEGRPVARGQVVLVTVDTTTGRSVEIPQELWAAVERVEGRDIAIEPKRSWFRAR